MKLRLYIFAFYLVIIKSEIWMWTTLVIWFRRCVFDAFVALYSSSPLQWRHNGRDGVSNHQPLDCLLNRLFRRRSKKTSKLRVTGFCAGNSPGTGEFPAQRASNAENVSITQKMGLCFSCSVQTVICANHRVPDSSKFVFDCLYSTPAHHHQYVELLENIEHKMYFAGIFCRMCV